MKHLWRAARPLILAVLAAVILIPVSLSCVPPADPGLAPVAVAPYQDGTVVVRNDNWSLVRVYISENGNTPFPLGRVESTRRESFRFHVNPGSTYLFTLVPLAGNSGYTTEGVQVDSGGVVNLYVATTLSFTTVVRALR